MKRCALCFVVAAFGLLAGCYSFETMQTMLFIDEAGGVIKTEYDRADKEHVGTFVAQLTGEELEFRTKLSVRVTLSDGTRFRGWRTMDTHGLGTKYISDDEHWIYFARGLTSMVYEQLDDKSDYKLVFEGVMCNAGNNAKRGVKR